MPRSSKGNRETSRRKGMMCSAFIAWWATWVQPGVHGRGVWRAGRFWQKVWRRAGARCGSEEAVPDLRNGLFGTEWRIPEVRNGFFGRDLGIPDGRIGLFWSDLSIPEVRIGCFGSEMGVPEVRSAYFGRE